MSTRAIRTRSRSPAAPREVAGKSTGLSAQRAAVDGLLGLLCDRLDHGVLLLDADLAVLGGNLEARRALTTGDGIALRAGRFAFADAEAQRRLNDLLSRQAREPQSVPASLGVRVRRRYAPAFRVAVTPVGDRLVQWGVAYVVLICGLGDTREISPTVLREVYELTRAQTDVAASLYGGLSVEQTASALGLSLNTVRSHLKKIFAKCGVASQAELMQMLALGPHAL